MKPNISRWIILLLALTCAVQAVSAFKVTKEEITPASGDLEVGQSVSAHYVIAYSMNFGGPEDEAFEFSTGLQSPSWTFIIYRDGIPIYTTERSGYYPKLGSFELAYKDRAELDIQLRGIAPKTSSGEVEIIRLEHIKNKNAVDSYRMTRKVVSAEQIESSLAIQQQNLKNLKADIDARAAEEVDISAAQAKYDDANRALTSAASAAPSRAAEHIATAIKAMDEAKPLLDKAWAEKNVSDTGVALESLDSKINYFIEERSMGGDPRVVFIVTKRESAAQFYSLAKDALNMNNYPLARSRASDGLRKVNEALADAHAFREKISSGSLDVRSTPSGASIYIDGTYKGVTPFVVLELSEGSYQVKLSRSGYNDYTQTAFITTGETTIVSATLSPTPPPTGALYVKSTPSGASVYIDGTYKGVTPLVVSELSGGSHQVRLTKGGYYDHTRTVSITAGYAATVSANLSSSLPDPPKKSPTTMFFWLIAAAIVISVGGFIYTRKKRGAQTDGPKADATHSSNVSAGYGTGRVPHPDAISPPGKAGASVQKGSSPTPGKSGTDVVLPDGGSAASTAKPEISITLSHTSIHADEWDKIGLTLVNAGTAHAFDITLAFPNDIDTRLIQPVNLAPGTSTMIEAGIRPRTKGKIPLEIIVRYRDAGNQTYKQTTSFWLLVEPRSDSIPPGSPIPSSIPRPMTPKSLPQEMADRYTASEFIGKGGFARVFKVQKPDGSWVALKIPISLDAATGRSFIAELQNWTSLVHDNIVRVNDYNIMPLPYFELELCDGTLAELEKPVPPEHAAWLIFNICEGLKYAHARGILHRDLKPQNIMLRDGVPKISDWGLSKVMMQSGTTTTSGGFTAYYAAPEQITNKPKDERTDIWQIGVILYELITGRLPFTGESMVEIGMAIATKTPERPGAVHPDAEPLDKIIQKCLEKDPDQRYRSVIDLQKDLTAYLKMNYIESLKESIQTKNFQRSAYYCGDLVLISMKIGDLMAAYKYANDLVSYSTGEARKQAIELARQIKARVEMGAQELPDELVRKAEVVVHQIRMQG